MDCRSPGGSIEISAMQADSLTSLIHLAFGLTAAKLSEISGRSLRLEPPSVGIYTADDIAREIESLAAGPVTWVSKAFSGTISGSAVLVLRYEAAQRLSHLLVPEKFESPEQDCVTDQVLVEIGNMVLNSSLGVVGNLLQGRIGASPARLHLDSPEEFIASVVAKKARRWQAVVLSFTVAKEQVEGWLLMVLDAASLQRLIQALTAWDQFQAA